jgi:hypothetical protein
MGGASVPGEGAAVSNPWNNYYHVITAGDAVNKYFDLPEDVNGQYADKTILTVETDVQAPTEYEVTVDGEGRLRRVSWAGKGLETDPPMREGWRCWVLYYVSAGSAPAPGETVDHSALGGRDLPNQHPIGAVSGLEEALEAKQDALTAGSGVKINDAVVSLDIATPAEALAGTDPAKAMTPLTARGAIDSTPAGNPATIFANPGAADMGTRVVTISDAAAGKSPMYMLYGTASTQIYLVQTYGSATRIEQRAVLTDNSRREFERQCVGSVWSAWRELPTFSYVPNSLTLIVDGENGDDSTAKGTEALPYKTIQAALNAIPMNFTSVAVRIKAGEYQAPGQVPFRRGNSSITLTSYTGGKDVVLSNADSISIHMNFIFFQAKVLVSNLKFVNSDASTGGVGLAITDCLEAEINNCEFEGFSSASDSAGIRVRNCGMAGIGSCVFKDAGIGIYALLGGNTFSSNNTSGGGLGYGLRTHGTVIRKNGTQPDGTIANEAISGGGQIL